MTTSCPRVDNPSHNHNNNHPANNNHQDEGVGGGGGVLTSPRPNSLDSIAAPPPPAAASPQEQEDPDWDTLEAEHEPNHDKIRLFFRSTYSQDAKADETFGCHFCKMFMSHSRNRYWICHNPISYSYP